MAASELGDHRGSTAIKDVVVRDAGRKGLGVFALRRFRKGEFIFRRRYGRIVANTDIRSLSREDLNHSSEPKAMRGGVKVFAWRPIAAGEEITIDYRLNALGSSRSKCLCGTASCPGEITGSFFALPPETQRDHLPFAPRFIHEEYRRRLR